MDATEDLALSPLSKSPDDEIEEEQCLGCINQFGNCWCYATCQECDDLACQPGLGSFFLPCSVSQSPVNLQENCIVWELSPRVPSCIQVLELDTVAPETVAPETVAPDEVPLQDVSNLFDIDERPIHITVLKEHLEMCGLPVPKWVLVACAN